MALTQPPRTAVSDTASTAREGGPRRDRAVRTDARSLPIVPVRARGLTIEGADGRRYLDCFPGAGALVLGHNHPVVLEAVRSVLDSDAPLHAPGLATPVEDAFRGELSATLPGELAESAHIRFCGPTGTEAVTAALRLARAATGREGLLASPGTGPPFARQEVPVSASDDRLRRLRDITAARAIPLIVDEAQTGVGRTGAFWAVEHSGIVPDVLVLSEAIGGGLPLAALVHRDGLGPCPPGDSAGVFRGNQLALAAGTATLRYVRENGLAGRARAVGERMLSQLRQLAREQHSVGAVRGRGLMIGIELATPGRSGESPAATAWRECLDRGLIVGVDGRHPRMIRLLPPLTITDEQTEAVLDRLSDALAAISGAGRRASTPSKPKEAGAASPARPPRAPHTA